MSSSYNKLAKILVKSPGTLNHTAHLREKCIQSLPLAMLSLYVARIVSKSTLSGGRGKGEGGRW